MQRGPITLRVTCVAAVFALILAASMTAPAAQSPGALKDPAALKEAAPATFTANFVTSAGNFVVTVTRAWAPAGADRFYNLVKNGFFDNVRFFRAIPNFMVQFGIHGDPAISAAWRNARLPVDKVTQSNKRGFITYAMGFAPFGQVTTGMDVVDKIFTGYGEGAPRGKGPDQGRLQAEGNAYLMKEFPKLDYVKSATIGK